MIVTILALAAGLGADMSGAPIAVRATPVSTTAPRAARELVVCNRDEASRRAFKREYGEVRYVSAQDVVDSRDSATSWDAPRCITPTEYQRLESMVGELRWVDDSRR
ncbi:MAG: hypothetical protein KF842_05875 [Caulobacter sp.]|nr:hypothetical protein [Caulobacter sp.]